jgi:shikimate kinase
MNIVLIGFRCSGKTVVGKMVAREMGRDFVDTDELIEVDTGYSIEKIISIKGWPCFRRIEKKVIKKVAQKNNLVIATGGGVVMDKENLKNLKKNGWTVWLDANPEVLKQRMFKEKNGGIVRPSLTGADPLEEIQQVLDVRRPLYKEAANIVIDSTALYPWQVADSIINAVPEEL